MKPTYKCLSCKKEINKIISRPGEPLVFRCKCGAIFTDEMLFCFVEDSHTTRSGKNG